MQDGVEHSADDPRYALAVQRLRRAEGATQLCQLPCNTR